MIITLPPGTTVTLSTVNLVSFSDSPDRKKVTATVCYMGIYKPLVLWEGDAYDAAGQYTDSDVQKRIVTLLTS